MTIGSIVSMPASGRMGVVVGSTALGETAEGKQRVVMQVKSKVPESESGAKGAPAPLWQKCIARWILKPRTAR